ncbi:putative nuclear RNA binding protein [Neospora caninum Liverpool]|uniref:Nuclear RNA binding protein, putative n=1 Tax=Neospora caninum (strain Liverpool) TaxID=572307 RepID=F0V8A0_NEOCL|nr:putative nuclear RNA binding protein [Neospora caninum Liverpool]CBZ49941.1 putative nuclear RNA binding protein [Neospora caninum Liverpool]CEL64529.1 TPA: nuclear RNA binding protein, putative [Neospora caninum Liverpool]|eukprot:XP_003879976.1 putative nuclear RNA binding protein [Neospora caninum Liverpool]
MAPQRKYYTVGVSNKFSAFADNDSEGGDSSGEEDVILSSPPAPTGETQSTGKQLSGTNAGSGKKANEGVSAHHDSERRPRATTGGRFGREEQSGPGGVNSRHGEFGGRGRGGFRGGRFPRRNLREGNEVENEEEQGVEAFGQRRNFRGGRGRGGFYSRGRGGAQGGYDRHTPAAMGGRDPKKSGGGAHNWGDDERVAAAGEQEAEKVEEKEKREDGEEDEEKKGEEEEAVEEEKKEEVLDLEAYKKMLEGKRQNLPNFIKKSNKKITTDQELEAEGYTLHVKEGREEEEETTSEEEDEHEEPKKKTMNVFEYIHNGGGRVNLFPGRRRGRGAGPSGSREFRGGRGRGRGGSFVKSRDAPDIQDERAFPTLGGR